MVITHARICQDMPGYAGCVSNRHPHNYLNFLKYQCKGRGGRGKRRVRGGGVEKAERGGKEVCTPLPWEL